MRKPTAHLALRGMVLAALGLACSKAGVVAQSPSATGSAPVTPSGGGAGGGRSGTGGIPLGIDPSTAPSTGDTVDSGITQAVPCTDGVGCQCPALNVAVIGKPGKWGANPAGDSDTALQEWLNSSSAGTAKADNFTQRVTLTPDFLAPYSVIILAALADESNAGPFWTFDDSEVAAFADWVQNKGGGVVVLTGYSGNGSEVNAPNQLIAFSGIAYNMDGIYADCPDWNYCGCCHSNPLANWIRTDPVIANLSNSVTWVGFDNGRSITAPADAHVAATAAGGANALVGKVVGKGRVLAYADEWITYTTQWNGQGNPSASDPTCANHLPQDAYQTAQFWYNMIKWVQPRATCFKIVDGQQPVTIW